MLDYAKKYINELAVESVWAQFDKKNKFFFVGSNNGIELIDDKDRCHEFVSLDNKKRLLGFIRYFVFEDRAINLEIISFDDNSSIFAKDLIEALNNVFVLFELKSLSGSFSVKHPLLKKYLAFMKKHRGEVKLNDKKDYYLFTLYKK